MKKILSYLKNPGKLLVVLMNKNFLFWLSDVNFLKLKFRLLMGDKLNLDNPKTFNEKLQWLKLYDRKDIYTVMADKYAVRDFVAEKIGKEYLVPLLGVYDSYEEINFDVLPNKFVIKPNHTSGDVFICTDKKKINHRDLRKKIGKWLKRNYYLLHREWPYKNIKRKIIIEKYLEELSGDIKDYKFFMFNGKLAYSLVCSDRFSNLKFTFFDADGNFMDVTQDGCPNDKDVSGPSNYEKMIELASKLASGTKQLRVDFYEICGKIYFGELTFFDSAGFGKFDPKEWDLKIGEMLDLSGNE